MTYQKYTDDLLAIIVGSAGTAFAGYIVYTTGTIPEFFAVGFGLIMAFHFTKTKSE